MSKCLNVMLHCAPPPPYPQKMYNMTVGVIPTLLYRLNKERRKKERKNFTIPDPV